MKKESFFIKGLAGKRKLSGEIVVNGAKNACLPVMASSLLFEGGISISNVPKIEDVSRMSELLENLGAKIDSSEDQMNISFSKEISGDLDEEISKRMRASIFLIGPLLSRVGAVSFPHPGGCVIGERPIDLFLFGFEKMGASVEEKNGKYFLKAGRGGLKGAEIFFPFQSVGATETLMMAAVLAKGKTILKNVALEPEVVSLGKFLSSCGAKIKGLGTTTLEIEGGGLLKNNKREHKIIPDRIEAGCFLILGALSATDLLIKNCEPNHLEALIALLGSSGVNIEIGENWIRVKNDILSKSFSGFNVKTHEYPGFPTDLQAPITVFLTQANGSSVVFETLFDSRLNYTADLIKMGADITLWDAHRAMVKGPTPLKGRELDGPDIRAGLAFVIAAIVGRGNSTINNIYYIDRGYEKIEERLRKIKVNIERVGS